MASRFALAAVTGGALGALALVMAPAIGAPRDASPVRPRVSLNTRGGIGSFTPADADPRIVAMMNRASAANTGSSFRFTPVTASAQLGRSLTVAVRARTGGAAPMGQRSALVAPPAAVAIAPIAYNLGVAVGWKRFALSGDIAKVDQPGLGGRENVDVGVSYNTRRWSARVAATAERPTADTPRPLAEQKAYSVDVGGAYRLTRNFDVTAGVRYRRAQNDRLETLTDNRRDSQAVYVGTAFRF